MQTLDFLDKKSLRDDVPAFGPGDTLNVHVKIVEGKNHRIQVFKGFVVGRQVQAFARPSPSARFPSVLVLSVPSPFTLPPSRRSRL